MPEKPKLKERTLRENLAIVKKQIQDLEQEDYTPKEWLELNQERKSH
jgi:hypothetical protein